MTLTKLLITCTTKVAQVNDGLSNKIIKTIKNEISKPLTLIMNQMIKFRIFPDSLNLLKYFHYIRKMI